MVANKFLKVTLSFGGDIKNLRSLKSNNATWTHLGDTGMHSITYRVSNTFRKSCLRFDGNDVDIERL